MTLIIIQAPCTPSFPCILRNFKNCDKLFPNFNNICENHDMESVGENNEENVMFFGVPKLIERLIAGCL